MTTPPFASPPPRQPGSVLRGAAGVSVVLLTLTWILPFATLAAFLVLYRPLAAMGGVRHPRLSEPQLIGAVVIGAVHYLFAVGVFLVRGMWNVAAQKKASPYAWAAGAWFLSGISEVFLTQAFVGRLGPELWVSTGWALVTTAIAVRLARVLWRWSLQSVLGAQTVTISAVVLVALPTATCGGIGYVASTQAQVPAHGSTTTQPLIDGTRDVSREQLSKRPPRERALNASEERDPAPRIAEVAPEARSHVTGTPPAESIPDTQRLQEANPPSTTPDAPAAEETGFDGTSASSDLFSDCITSLYAAPPSPSAVQEAKRTVRFVTEDAIHDALLAVCESHRRRPKESLRPYFFRAVANASRMKPPPWAGAECAGDDAPSCLRSPEDDAASREWIAAVERAQCHLTRYQSAALRLAVEGDSSEEIAQKLGKTPEAVRRVLSDARQALRAHLPQQCR